MVMIVMDFNNFFNGNEYILLGILFYFLFNNERHKDYNAKIIVIYSLMIALFLLKTFNIYGMLFIFLLLFFFQFEIFIEDKFKHKLFCNLIDKIVDSLYLLIFKFRFILFLIILFLIKNVDIYNLKIEDLYYIVPCVFILIYIILFVSNNTFELNTFDKIYDDFKPNSFGTFAELDDVKRNILIEREDRTFLYRNRSYNFISFWIIIFKIKTLCEIIINRKDFEISNSDLKKDTLLDRFKRIFYYIKRQFRGHGTLEMQLYRQVAVKDGYRKVGQRKFSEIVYSQLLFKNLKRYLKKNFDKVSDRRYKMYIINLYLKFAPVFIGNIQYRSYNDLFKNRDVSNCDFFLYTLGVAGKINKYLKNDDNLIDENLFRERYSYYIWHYNFSNSEVKDSIKYFNKKQKK